MKVKVNIQTKAIISERGMGHQWRYKWKWKWTFKRKEKRINSNENENVFLEGLKETLFLALLKSLRTCWMLDKNVNLKHESCLHFNNWCLEMLRVFEKWKLESALTFPSMSSNLRSETGSGSSEIWELGKEKSFLRRGMIVPISKILRSYQIHATRKVGQLQTKFI